jgi:uncharacterized repeat protein (TIGR03803 family)
MPPLRFSILRPLCAIALASCGQHAPMLPATSATSNAPADRALQPPNAREHVIYSFRANDDGSAPEAPVFRDAAGVLYGTTQAGGKSGQGTVFKIVGTTETVLHSFNGGDGYEPVASVIEDASGNLYGTVSQGGGESTFGVVFELTPSGSGYSERTLHVFQGGNDGGTPTAPLMIDSKGALYGTTEYGGASENGVVFKLTPSGSSYTEKVLYSFKGRNVGDGQNPMAGLIGGSGGVLYGTTQFGGTSHACGNYGCGTVFMLTPSGSHYTERVIYQFTGGKDGSEPLAGVIVGPGGALYGANFGGSVFKLIRNGSGFTESTLHHFNGGASGGVLFGGIVADRRGALYGTTAEGGNGYGTVFRMVPSGSGYKVKTLYAFGTGKDAETPKAGVIVDKALAVFGTTYAGGANGAGAVFEITQR